MRERSRTRSGFVAAMAMAGWLLAGAVEAQQLPDPAVPPEGSNAGGIPACQVNLGTCIGDVGTCTGDLTTCEGDLATCEASQAALPGDGQGNGPELAYEVCADGLTVADLNTGLLWERKVAGGDSTCDLVNLHLVDSRCVGVQIWINAVNAEGGTGFAGFSDWRVPNLKELLSIVDYGTSNPAIDPSFPGETASDSYWSATLVVGPGPSTGYQWFMDFTEGFTGEAIPLAPLAVRAVRSGPCSTP